MLFFLQASMLYSDNVFPNLVFLLMLIPLIIGCIQHEGDMEIEFIHKISLGCVYTRNKYTHVNSEAHDSK